MKKVDVDKVVRNFQEFLVAGWDNIQFSNKILNCDDNYLDDDLLNEWCQANWELMVEELICEKPHETLNIYWNGGDFNSPSSRVWDIENLPNHEVFAKKKSEETIKDYLSGKQIDEIEDMVFESFATFSDNYFNITPPFDYILLGKGEKYFLVSLDDIIFDCKPYSENPS